MILRPPDHKTKIVCTLGPASRSEEVLEHMMRQGMTVARLNLAHGTPEGHREDIGRIRSASARLNRSCMILADLPGPKIRIGRLAKEPVDLEQGSMIVLTTREVEGTVSQVSINYERLTESLSEGSLVYLNDGFIQLQVEDVQTDGVVCRVLVGGSLLSYKGVNLPGAPIFVDPVSERDLQLVRFGLDEGVDAFGLSFVERAADILKVRDFITSRGGRPMWWRRSNEPRPWSTLTRLSPLPTGLWSRGGTWGSRFPSSRFLPCRKSLSARQTLPVDP